MKKQLLFSALLSLNLIALNIIEVRAEADDSNTSATEQIETDLESDLKFPVVDTSQWRTGNFKFPWSQPVTIDDAFDGKYIAVLDRERNRGLGIGAEAGIVSEWSRKHIKVNFYYSVKQLFGKPRMSIGYAERIELRVGDSSFKLDGKRGVFEVTEEMKEAFANAKEPAKMKIFPSEHEGDDYFSAMNDEAIIDIKQETVDAWNVVYGNSQVAAE